MILTINGIQAALKKGSSIEYVSENRLFTDADNLVAQAQDAVADEKNLRSPGYTYDFALFYGSDTFSSIPLT